MNFIKILSETIELSIDDSEKISSIFKELKQKYTTYKDPWGFDLELCEQALRKILPIYRYYFNVRVFGKENVKDEPYIVVSNHTGQIPIDGLLIGIAFLMDTNRPRLLRAMVERFMVQLPFIADYSYKLGAVLGDRTNCEFLIDNKESILVFPEGVKGVSKSTMDYYKTQAFTQGFYRIALQKHTKILPIAVIGAEEMFPFVYQAKGVAKLLSLPAMPLSLNYFPLPSPVDIYIGKPINVPEEMSHDAPEKEIREQVYKVEMRIKRLISVGLKHRRPFFEDIRTPVKDYIKKFKVSRYGKA